MCRLIMRLDNSYVLYYWARTMRELDNIIVLLRGTWGGRARGLDPESLYPGPELPCLSEIIPSEARQTQL